MRPDPVVPDPGLEPIETLTESPPAIHQVHRRPAGIHPVPLLGAAGTLAVVLAIILLVAGSLVAGLILLGVAVAAVTLFVGGVAREPNAPTAAPVLRGAKRAASLRGLAAVEARAWGRACPEVVRIRYRQWQLRRRLKAGFTPLGEAVHQGDQVRTQALTEQAQMIERELTELDRKASTVTRAAREEVARERVTLQPTQSFGRLNEPTEPSENTRR